MIIIKELQQTCGACPTQYSGTTIDGKQVYIRFRYGILRIEINGNTVFRAGISDGLDGVISLDEIKKATRHLNIGWLV